jgi:hypothetical protein
MKRRNLMLIISLFLLGAGVFAQESDKTLDGKIQYFWDTVKQREERFFNDELSTSEDYALLTKAIKAIDEKIDALVMTNLVDGKRRLIITSYCNPEYFDLADKIVAKAPELKYLHPFSLFPHTPDIIPFVVDGTSLELKDIKVHYDEPINGKYDILLLLPEKHRIKITYDKTDENYKAYRQVVFYYLIQLFGERLMYERIAEFDLFRVNVFIKDINLLQFYENVK